MGDSFFSAERVGWPSEQSPGISRIGSPEKTDLMLTGIATVVPGAVFLSLGLWIQDCRMNEQISAAVISFPPAFSVIGSLAAGVAHPSLNSFLYCQN